MESISSKATIKLLVAEAVSTWQQKGQEAFIISLHDTLLKKKVRFPLLEYAAKEIAAAIPEAEHIDITDRIINLREIGSQVLAGMVLQFRLDRNFEASVSKACDYIQFGDQWYVCDIIGERVLGYALLTMPEKTIPLLAQLSRHEDKWIVRTVGVATHYAVKKGLDLSFVEPVFRILLSLSDTTDFHTKKGIGWGAKTVARFHPQLVARYHQQLASVETRQWFRTKINIGLHYSQKK
ncbi:DNA alkylation repair protein [Chitinophaga sp. G-6-1-13]|uniref:DNA alkylation repair protein n=1 Tax=Chitinophaga fulva TaxID=2728842 RepID=A0A848GT79_9BACT|nr:DNA alkylation repair protein [Chitinophaga fulva]NML40332.1 DNA alkylation repair protein [Chitinophaga fulva]